MADKYDNRKFTLGCAITFAFPASMQEDITVDAGTPVEVKPDGSAELYVPEVEAYINFKMLDGQLEGGVIVPDADNGAD